MPKVGEKSLIKFRGLELHLNMILEIEIQIMGR